MMNSKMSLLGSYNQTIISFIIEEKKQSHSINSQYKENCKRQYSDNLDVLFLIKKDAKL